MLSTNLWPLKSN